MGKRTVKYESQTWVRKGLLSGVSNEFPWLRWNMDRGDGAVRHQHVGGASFGLDDIHPSLPKALQPGPSIHLTLVSMTQRGQMEPATLSRPRSLSLELWLQAPTFPRLSSLWPLNVVPRCSFRSHSL